MLPREQSATRGDPRRHDRNTKATGPFGRVVGGDSTSCSWQRSVVAEECHVRGRRPADRGLKAHRIYEGPPASTRVCQALHFALSVARERYRQARLCRRSRHEAGTWGRGLECACDLARRHAITVVQMLANLDDTPSREGTLQGAGARS